MNLGIFPFDVYLNISFLLIEEFINVTNTIFIALILQYIFEHYLTIKKITILTMHSNLNYFYYPFT